MPVCARSELPHHYRNGPDSSLYIPAILSLLLVIWCQITPCGSTQDLSAMVEKARLQWTSSVEVDWTRRKQIYPMGGERGHVETEST